MGLVLRCDECNKSYRTFEQLEALRDNESICLRCRALIEVDDWDELLVSWEESAEEAEEDFDDVEIDVEIETEKEGEPEEEEPAERGIDLVDEEGAFPGGMASLDEETEGEDEDEEEEEDE